MAGSGASEGTLAKARAEGAWGGGGDGVVSSSRFKKEINTNIWLDRKNIMMLK